MNAITAGIVVTIITFAGGIAGLYGQKLLPDQHSVEKSRDMIGSVMGLVTLLLALVLGTIVGSAYFFSATQQSELQALAAQSIQFDEALAQYGPEAKPLRDKWKGALDAAHQLFWGGADVDPETLTVANAMAGIKVMQGALQSLVAKTPEQTQALASANAHFGQIETTRLLMSLQLANPILPTASDRRGFLGVFPVLRFWSAFPPERHDAGRARVRRICRGKRDILDPRTQPALHGRVSYFPGGAGADNRRHRQIASAAKSLETCGFLGVFACRARAAFV